MITVAGRDLDILFTALDAELRRRNAGHIEICVIGGAALNAVGLITRPTKDVDVVAVGETSAQALTLSKSRPLPQVLAQAAAAVAVEFQIEPGWINAGPADLIDHGLPEGFATRLVPRSYGSALTVHYAGRLDQICFKTYAAADVSGRHLTDLEALQPTADEVRFALKWIEEQDNSDGFRVQLVELLEHLGMAYVTRDN
ncbi:MAG: hypothetical protein D9V44_10460 [Actinobacteria bacterium]|nr:MAG: hypothetical protein D9V44_10460 [Actinomycetota bacterium]